MSSPPPPPPPPQTRPLSPYYIITPDPTTQDPVIFLKRLLALLQQTDALVPTPFVQLRSKSLNPTLLAQTYASLLSHIPLAFHPRILLNAAPPSGTPRTGGVHLPGHHHHHQHDDDDGEGSSPRPRPDVLAVSCHSTDDMARAERAGAAFVVLSPVLPSRSCPSDATLGWDGFEAM
ncbi:hypothetical protein HKX48_000608, partial [Thoreauomyces humboldtii]